MRKEKIQLLVPIFLMVLLLSGCMSSQERADARQTERLGKTMLKDGMKQVYQQNYRIDNIRTLTVQSSNGFFPIERYATDYVKAAVSGSGERFNVLLNTQTGDLYDDKNRQALMQSMHAYVQNKTGIPAPDYTEFTYAYKDVTARINTGDALGFSLPGITDFEALLLSGSLQISTAYQWIDTTSLDLSTVSAANLLDAMPEGTSLSFGMMNYIDSRDYFRNDSKLKGSTDYVGGFFNHTYAFGLKDTYVAITTQQDEESSGHFERYQKINIAQRDQYRIAWVDSCFEITFEQTTAPNPMIVRKKNYRPIAAEIDTMHVRPLHTNQEHPCKDILIQVDHRFVDKTFIQDNGGQLDEHTVQKLHSTDFAQLSALVDGDKPQSIILGLFTRVE